MLNAARAIIRVTARSCAVDRRTAAAAALCLLVPLPTAPAVWGGTGHRLVGEYAQRHLSPRAAAEVQRLLSLEPGATLASISTWADETRTPATAAWHYVNLPRDGQCHFDAAVSCADGNCVVGAIERQLAILASPAGDAERLQALKYVVHFVGDVYQPLHGGFADDRGGNQYQLQAFGRGTNLHALWDAALIDHWPGGERALSAAMEEDATDGGPAIPAEWAESSCRAASTPGFYPDGHVLPADYPAHWSEVLVQRLAHAGRQLAAVLDEALGGP